MPRFPKPWFRKERQAWFVQVDGRQINLGPDRESALKRYHALMNEPKRPRVSAESVVALCDLFLDWCEKHRSPATYEWYRDRLQAFAKTIPADLKAAMLRPFHVQAWIDSQAQWSNGSKRNGCRAVQRAMHWAEQQGYLDRSPIAHLEKPPAGRREQVATAEEYRALLSLTRDREFRELLTAAWETGARPQEILHVEARHVDLQNARWVFPPAESKMKRFPRIVYLTDEALSITKRLLLKHPQGRLFRNTCGRPWTTDAVNCRFTTVEKKLGTRYCLYVFRHSWATRALERGVDPLTVAILMGHADPSMLAKTYQHLSQNPKYLQDAAKRATA
jgi:integrase